VGGGWGGFERTVFPFLFPLSICPRVVFYVSVLPYFTSNTFSATWGGIRYYTYNTYSTEELLGL
jgi:hypothetical protein